MKKLLISAALLAPLTSFAACKHIEYSELKAMSTLSMALEYCDVATATKLANDMRPSDIELHKIDVQAYGPDSRQAIASLAKIEKASEAAEVCQNETDRIYKMLMSRKLKSADKELVTKCKGNLP